MVADENFEASSELIGEIDEIERLHEVGALDAAQSMIGVVEHTLMQARRDLDLTRADQLMAELEALSPPESVLFDARSELDQQRIESNRSLSTELVPRLEQLVADHRAKREQEALDLLHRIDETLSRDRAEFSDEAMADLELQQAGVKGYLDLRDTTRAIASARDLLRAIEAKRIHQWRVDQGETDLIDHICSFCTAELDFEQDDVLRMHAALEPSRS